MNDELLKVSNLHVKVQEGEILHGADLEIKNGEAHVLMGPNGRGKYTRGYALIGHPDYEISDGKIEFLGEDITEAGADERAKKGIFLSFQNPIEVPGVSLSSFIRSALEQISDEKIKVWDFNKSLKETMKVLDMDESYAERDLNVGFSGGEKKKAEVLQLLMLKPKLAILDETDSGLDVDAVKTVSAGIEEFQKRCGGALLIITHSTKILESLKVDKVHIMLDGKIGKEGGFELVDQVNENGFSF